MVAPVEISHDLSFGHTITQSVWLNGIDRMGFFTLCRTAAHVDFTCSFLTVDGQNYSLCLDASIPLFDQWIYLVCPEESEASYLRESLAVFTPGLESATLLWVITVDYVSAACTAAGLQRDLRDFTLVFHRVPSV
jgi:hypothetical protein